MATSGYVLASAPDESSAVSEYFAGAGSFSTDVSNAQFFAASTNTIQAMRVEEGALQQANSGVDIRLTSATQGVSLAADNDSAGGWIYGSAPDENSPLDSYFDGAGFVADINSAEFFSKAEGRTLAFSRQEEGRYQAIYTDRDIRMLPATAAITVV